MRFYSDMHFHDMLFNNDMKNFCRVVRVVALLTFSIFGFALAASPSTPPAHGNQYIFYVGTYTQDNGKPTASKGIYAFRYDAANAQITSLGLAAETTNPSWVAPSPDGKFLYAANELGNYKGPNSGGISAFSVDKTTGKLTFLNEMPTRGADPCYVSVDRTGKYVLVANYTGGSVAVFPILADGKLGEATAFVQHTGHGPNAQRQEAPHAHSIDLSFDNRFAYVDDLGLDELLVYKFDSAKGTLTPNDPPFTKVDAGAGPRHFVLHPGSRFAYVITEMGRSVTVFSNDPVAGKLQAVQTLSTLPRDFSGRNDDAEIRMHPSGRFLYASNRGQDTIVVYSIDQDNGRLTKLGSVPTGGKEPRNFEIDPTGTLLFAENQNSNDIVVFKIDASTGNLTPTGKTLNVGAPVCIKFVKVD